MISPKIAKISGWKYKWVLEKRATTMVKNIWKYFNVNFKHTMDNDVYQIFLKKMPTLGEGSGKMLSHNALE